MKHFYKILTVLLTLATMAMLSPAPLSAQFTNVSIQAGIDLIHDGDGSNEPPPMGSVFGSGAAWLDYNNDGWLDLYVTMRVNPNRLYHNNGDGTFTDMAEALGVDDPQGDGAGVAAADYDNDGWTDLYLANGKEDKLFRNINGASFEDVTPGSGLEVSGNSRGTSASWGDYDRDGYLDLYVAHHIPISDQSNATIQDFIFHNNGDGTFTDVSYLFDAADLSGASFIAAWVDFDNDCDLDIINITDCPVNGVSGPLRIYRNNGGTDALLWNFEEVSVQVGVNDCKNGMGIAVGDIDHNGWLDFYYSNIGPATLYKNTGGIFSEATGPVLGSQGFHDYSWGTCFFDYDNDGWQDVLLTLGKPRDIIFPTDNQLFRNEGDGATFTDVSDAMNMNDPERSRSAIYGDYDNDGDLDVFVLNYNEVCHLKRNDTNNDNNWLKVTLAGSTSNRMGIGAKVRIRTPDGDQQLFEIRSGSNLGGGDAIDAHFGLGANTVVDTVEVTWPNCFQQVMTDVAVNQTLAVMEFMGPPTCDDGVQNGDETGVDCGGPDCPPCPTCDDGIQNGSETGIDCGGPFCDPCPTCDDGIQNGNEEGVDCGGPDCPDCGTCNDGVRNGNETGIDCGGPDCAPCTHCNNGYQDADETGVDCGGADCPPCETVPTCDDGIQNGNETGIDCGGPDCAPCPSCNDGIQNGNETGVDCGGPDCPPCATCNDGIQNGNETGVDCGGPDCPPCATPTCDDGVQNGNETGVDCGGPDCPPCATPTCDDGVQNGDETGVDCGGPDCPPCNTPACYDLTLSITLDLFGGQTTWTVADDMGATVASGGPYNGLPGGTTVEEALCLPAGCYTFTIYDSAGNGICCRYGFGGYTLVDDANGDVLASGNVFGASQATGFCLGGGEMMDADGQPTLALPAGSDRLEAAPQLTVYPNPVAGEEVWVRYTGPAGEFDLQAYDVGGRSTLGLRRVDLSLPNQAIGLRQLGIDQPGFYLLTFTNGAERFVVRLVVP